MSVIVERREFCCSFHSVSHGSLRDNGISVTLKENWATTSLCKIVICQITTINDVPPPPPADTINQFEPIVRRVREKSLDAISVLVWKMERSI